MRTPRLDHIALEAVLGALVLIAHAHPAAASHLDGVTMDFDSTVEMEWQAHSTNPYPEFTGAGSGYDAGRYLGAFVETSVGFSGLDFFDYPFGSDLSKAYMSLDLLLFGDWRGNDPGNESSFTIDVGLETIFESTFSNHPFINSTLPGLDQSYPASIGTGSHPGTTGAFFLGQYFDVAGPGFETVSIYRINLEMDTPYAETSGRDIYVEFAASLAGESSGAWGLDNFVLSSVPIEPIPEPGSAVLVGLGLAVLGVTRPIRPGSPARSP